MHACIHTYIHTLHYITLHYITLHYITLHYITYIHTYTHTYTHTSIHACMHTYIHTYITLHYITLHYIHTYIHYIHTITLHYITLHYITLHYIHTYIYISTPLDARSDSQTWIQPSAFGATLRTVDAKLFFWSNDNMAASPTIQTLNVSCSCSMFLPWNSLFKAIKYPLHQLPSHGPSIRSCDRLLGTRATCSGSNCSRQEPSARLSSSSCRPGTQHSEKHHGNNRKIIELNLEFSLALSIIVPRVRSNQIQERPIGNRNPSAGVLPKSLGLRLQHAVHGQAILHQLVTIGNYETLYGK